MIDRCPKSWRALIKDDLAFLEEIDPDWKDHLNNATTAVDYYFDYMHPEEFLRVQKLLK